jgi:hypothetical protein
MDHTVTAKELIETTLPGLPGWCTVEKGLRMAELARGAKLCVELGVFGARGLVSLAAALREQGFGEAHGIDPYTVDAALEGKNAPANDEWWSHNVDLGEIARIAQLGLERLGLTSWARIIWEKSQDVVSRYDDGSVDLLHQDSNHAEAVTCAEVALWTPKIRPGGYWVFDDTDWETTKRAQRELEALGFKLIEDHVSWKVYQKP